MKILIAYDGSSSSDLIFRDLQRAGMPEEVEAQIVSVAAEWFPAPGSFAMVEVQYFNPKSVWQEAHKWAEEATQRLRKIFPKWNISEKVVYGSAARVLIEEADVFHPDLLVLGARGHSGIGKLLLGSVSQKVLRSAHCSVRVSRDHEERPDNTDNNIRIVVGVDGSDGASEAVKAVLARSWPSGTEVRTVTADLPVAEHMPAPIAEWIHEERARVNSQVDWTLAELAAKGLKTSSVLKHAEAKDLLCEEAETWKADVVFVGAKQMTKMDRFLLGSVSASVSERAHCSVEVVRPKNIAK
ncbi:MAG: universal stress protein [Acidobacteria bacterium]|nr:universal stress protein [Acidobacteriota bacterium]